MMQLVSHQSFWIRVRRIAKRTMWISVGLFVANQIAIPLAAGQSWRPILITLNNTAFWLFASAALVWITARIASWWLKGPLRWGIFAPKVRKAHLIGVFDEAIHTARVHDLHLIRVLRVYQAARRGTKCVVEHPGGVRQDAWFWNFNPKRGHVFMVRATNAYGPHNSNAHVMYIGSQITGAGVVGGIPTSAWKTAHQQAKR